MAFESIPQIPTPQTLMQEALREGRKAKVTRRKSDQPREHLQKKERERVIAIAKHLRTRLAGITRAFPSVDTLTEFYRELLSTTVDLDELRETLARVQNTGSVVTSIGRDTRGRISGAKNEDGIKAAVGSFIGRTSSVVERLEGSLTYLEDVRRTLRSYPTIKDRYTVCIAGFPNVGKSTLLGKITGASPEVANYAFTTKGLNAGYRRIGHAQIQFVDTPGTLNRDHMNAVELQAHLALKYLADLILYVYDPTQSFPLEDQERLRERMQDYGKPVHDYLSKTDIAPQDIVAELREKHVFITQEELERLLIENTKKRY